MNNIRISKYFYIILLFVLFVSNCIGHASETFQNALLRMDFGKNPAGEIKVVLYTSKPYNDTINVNKKSDFEYVILMPETANSMTANPILNAVAGVVKAVMVKTQQYENNVKGYTKITIATSKPVEITSQAQNLKDSDYRLSESDYKELLAQTAKQTKIQPKTEIKKPLPVKKETVKSVQKPKFVETVGSAKRKTQVYGTKRYIAQTARRERNLYQSKPHSYKKAIVKPQIVEKPKHIKTKPIETKPSIQQDVITPPMVETKITTPVENMKEKTTLQTQTVTQPVVPVVKENIPPVQNEGKFTRYKNIIKNNLYTILGLIAAVFILLLLGARRTVKNINKQKETFINHLDEQPSAVTDYTEKISEDMTWKEKFQTYREAAQEQSQMDETVEPAEEQFQDIEELDELFGSEPESSIEQDFLKEESVIENEIPETEVQQNEEESTLVEFDEMQKYNVEPQNVSIDELFGDEEIPLENKEEEFSFENPIIEKLFEEEILETKEQDEIIKSEFAIDEEKGFYLVDFEDTTALVGHIKDEIFILKRFKEKIEGALQARLNERKINSVNYMTKIGDFKALVEVTPDNMNLLIEL